MAQIAVQYTRIAWTKSDRGADGGTVRNALPREASFAPATQSARGWLQQIDYEADARGDYRRTERWHDLSTSEQWQLPIATQLHDERLWVRPNLFIQKPNAKRAQLDRWLVHLPFGHRAIIRANTAADYRAQRRYYEYHLTIGFAEDCTIDLPLFREVDERVLLY